MKKEITICDRCGKELMSAADIRYSSLDYRHWDLCHECRVIFDNASKEIKELNAEYVEKQNEVFKKYGIKTREEEREEWEKYRESLKEEG